MNDFTAALVLRRGRAPCNPRLIPGASNPCSSPPPATPGLSPARPTPARRRPLQPRRSGPLQPPAQRGPETPGLRPRLAGELVQGAELDLGARPLRAREMRRADVRALDAGGPRAVHSVDERREIAEDLIVAEGGLPYDGVD